MNYIRLNVRNQTANRSRTYIRYSSEPYVKPYFYGIEWLEEFRERINKWRRPLFFTLKKHVLMVSPTPPHLSSSSYPLSFRRYDIEIELIGKRRGKILRSI